MSSRLNFTYIQDLGKLHAALNNVNAATVPELQEVTSSIYSFLQMLDSQDENWKKLRYRLQLECPNFIPKLQASFLFYYSKCLEKTFFPNDDVIKSPEKGKRYIQELIGHIRENSNKDFFQYFKHLFEGKASAFEANELVVNFLEDTFHFHETLLGMGGLSSPSDMTVEDYFTNVANKINTEPEKKVVSNMLDAQTNENPIVRLHSRIVDAIYSACRNGTAVNSALKGVKDRYSQTFDNKDLNRHVKDWVNNFIENSPGVIDTKKRDELITEVTEQLLINNQSENEDVNHENSDLQHLVTQSETTGGLEDLASRIGKWVLQQYPGEELKELVSKI